MIRFLLVLSGQALIIFGIYSLFSAVDRYVSRKR